MLNGDSRFVVSATLKIVSGLFIADGIAELVPQFQAWVKVGVGVGLLLLIVFFDLRG